MTEPKKPEVGDRVEVIRDRKTGDGRIYVHAGWRGIVEAIDLNVAWDESPIEVYFGPDRGEDWVDFDDVRVVTAAADVDKENADYAITARITVEVEITVEGDGQQAAIDYFEAHALDYLNDFETMELKKTKVVSAFREDSI